MKKSNIMISRIWHGWTSIENADMYEHYLVSEILPGIKNRNIDGYLGAHLLRQEHQNEVEFITICWFENYKAVKEFAGENYAQSVVPDWVQKLLLRYDQVSQHYNTVKTPNIKDSEYE